MDLSEKIKQILTQKDISPSLFADEIGIQRSSISHILAGRNKPSLDIVQKIVKRFPELGVNWILDDQELPDQIHDIYSSKSAVKQSESGMKNGHGLSRQLNRKINPIQSTAQKNVAANTNAENAAKMVERILVFYSDGTFQEFKQG